jgi:lysophospholipase L1-like esterase
MDIGELVLIVVALFFVDILIRYTIIVKTLYPIKYRPMNRQRSITLRGTGKGSVYITLLGDSVLYGENSTYHIPAVKYIAQGLVKKKGTVVINNYAVTGSTINQLIDTQLPKVQQSDIIFIYVGGNDYFRFTSPRRFSRSVDHILEKLKGKTVIWCTLADPQYLYLVPIWQRYIFRYYAAAYMEYVENTIKWHPRENWYTIDFRYEPKKRLRSQKLNSRSLISDGFHLNDAGHEMWALIVKDAYIKLQQQGAKLP